MIYDEMVCVISFSGDDNCRAGVCIDIYKGYQRGKEKEEQVSQDTCIDLFGIAVLVWHVFDRLSGLCRRKVDLSVAGVGSVRVGACDHAAGGDNGKADLSVSEMLPIWLSNLHWMLPAALSACGRSGGEDYDSGANVGAGLYCGARCRRDRREAIQSAADEDTEGGGVSAGESGYYCDRLRRTGIG